jgi:hypothetical protein
MDNTYLPTYLPTYTTPITFISSLNQNILCQLERTGGVDIQ